MFAVMSSGIPQPGAAEMAVADEPAAAPTARAISFGDAGLLDPVALAQRYRDPDARISVVPPTSWALSPATSLDRSGDEDLYEVVRFQLRVGDAALYAQPLPVTSGLIADAGAVLSVALAREGSDLASLDPRSFDRDAVRELARAIAVDGENSYDGITTFTRVLIARETGRTAVIRAYVPANDRDAWARVVEEAIASTVLDADGPLGPKYVAPAPPPPPAPTTEPAVEAPPPDPSAAIRAGILERAASLLGTPYVWGGNSPGRAMDCSAYVSAAWGVQRYSTDSIWNVSVAIGKEDLRPGDAMDLETWRDPSRYGHIRIFDAWANAEHTLVWVYEETPPRAIHRVIAYDASYRPMRLAWLSGAGVAPLIPAPLPTPAPRLAPQPAPTRRVATATPRPTPRPTYRTPAPTYRTPIPTATARVAPTATPRVAPSITATPRLATATPRPTPTPSPSPTRR